MQCVPPARAATSHTPAPTAPAEPFLFSKLVEVTERWLHDVDAAHPAYDAVIKRELKAFRDLSDGEEHPEAAFRCCQQANIYWNYRDPGNAHWLLFDAPPERFQDYRVLCTRQALYRQDGAWMVWASSTEHTLRTLVAMELVVQTLARSPRHWMTAYVEAELPNLVRRRPQ